MTYKTYNPSSDIRINKDKYYGGQNYAKTI